MPWADPPHTSRLKANGTVLHVEVRGSGPAVLLIHAGGEDAEVWRPVAERLPGFTTVTYDRRGTLRSGRDDWPGGGSAQHADDAAALLEALGLRDAVVFGGSSAGIVALRMALRHSAIVRRALVFEPGLFRLVPGGEAMQGPVNQAVAEHLASAPGDWAGALDAFRRTVAASFGALLDPPKGCDWYAAREEMDAEALVRDDIPILTREVVDDADLAAASVDIGFSFGTRSNPVFGEIAARLAAAYGGMPIAIDGVGHLLNFHPDEAATYIRSSAESERRGRR
jgi:pimeloyl-ACP methyl ester carboxylesterase